MIDMTFFTIRIATIVLFCCILFIWHKEQNKTKRARPNANYTFKRFDYRTISKLILRSMYFVVILQLLGLSVLPIGKATLFSTAVGVILVIAGFAIAILARFELGVNWSNASDYQIKSGHELVTTGVYSYIRHPIYTGMSLFIIGCEFIALSYLSIPFFVLLFFGSYVQAKKEEKILREHFGKQYDTYRKHTKMLLPYLL